MATTTKVPTIPSLTADPAYAKALKRQDELQGMLLDVRAKQRRLQAEYSRLDAASTAGPAKSDREQAIDAFLKDTAADATEIDTRRTLATELADLGEKIEFLTEAAKKQYRTDVAPALGAAQRKAAGAVFDTLWRPQVRKAVEAVVAFHKQMADVLTLAEQISDAQLWVAPMDRSPIHQPPTTVGDHLRDIETLLREAVGMNYFTAAEAKAMLPPGLKL